MGTITNSEIKKIKSLYSKKFRDTLGLFVVEGEKMVKELLASNFEVVSVYNIQDIGNEAMKRISSLSTPSPILAVAKIPNVKNSVLNIKKDGLYIGLDSLRDPGNLGTILRLADWFGVDGVFASADTVDVFNPKVVQASMGSVFRVPIYYGNLADICYKIIEYSGKVYGTFLNGENIYKQNLGQYKDSPSIIIIGNESNGISADISKIVTSKLFIPPFKTQHPESLNAAVATAITLSEFRRTTII